MKEPKVPNFACERRPYIIYKLTNGKDAYVGMTTKGMDTRLKQHIYDAKTKKVCPALPAPMRSLHRKLRKDEKAFKMEKLKKTTGSFYQARQKEIKMQRKHSTVGQQKYEMCKT